MKLINFDVDDVGMTAELVEGFLPKAKVQSCWKYTLGYSLGVVPNYVMLGGLKGFNLSPYSLYERGTYSVKNKNGSVVVYDEDIKTSKDKGILFTGLKAKDGVHMLANTILVADDSRLFDKIELLSAGVVPLVDYSTGINAVLVCPLGVGYLVGGRVFCAVTGHERNMGRHQMSVVSLVKSRVSVISKKGTLTHS